MKLRRFFQAASAAIFILGGLAGPAKAAAPLKPAITTVTADALSINVTFKLGAYSAPISTIEYSTDDGAAWKETEYTCSAPTTCSVTVTETSAGGDLSYGTEYAIRVKVTNPDGSATSSVWPFQFVSAPLQPSITSLTATATAITVTFPSAASSGGNGGATLTGIDYSTNGGANWRSANCTACDAAGVITITQASTGASLSAGNTYTVTIRHKNRVGLSPAADAVSVTLGSAPSTPSISTITSGVDSLAVVGTLGAANGSPITAVEYSTDGGTTWKSSGQATGTFTITELSASKTPLTGGTTYSIRIRSVNNAGTSSASNTKSASPLAAYSAPAAPTIATLTPGLDSITVAGTLGAANGSAVTDVEYSTDGGTTWKSSGQATGTFTITELSASKTPLTGGTTYSIRIRSVNNGGASSASNAKSATPLDTPLPPVLDSVLGGANSLSIKATAGLLMGGTLQRIEYSTDGGTTWQNTAGTSLTFVITSPSSDKTKTLTPGTRYRVAVRSVTNAGTSPMSNVVEAAAGRVPATPTIRETSRSADFILVGVTVGSDNGSTITRIEYSTDNGTTWAEGKLNGAGPVTAPSIPTTPTAPGDGPTSTTPTTPVGTGSTFSGTVTLRVTTESNGTDMIKGDAAYKIVVRAVNAVGPSAASASKTIAADDSIDDPITITAPSSMTVGTSATVTTKSPNGSAVTLKSDTTGTCTVSGGKVTAVAGGSCKLSATDTSGNTGSASITVTATGSTAPSDKNTLTAGTTIGIRDYIVMAGDTPPPGAKFASTSKSPKFCKVAKGKVTALKAGNCRIWVKVSLNGATLLRKLSVPVAAKQ